MIQESRECPVFAFGKARQLLFLLEPDHASLRGPARLSEVEDKRQARLRIGGLEPGDLGAAHDFLGLSISMFSQELVQALVDIPGRLAIREAQLLL